MELSIVQLLLLYSVAVVVASVVGGLLPEWIRLTHYGMQLMISFVGGIMLGVAVFHMIPHALVAAEGDINQVMLGVMLGLVATFFLLRFCHFHQHEPADFMHAQDVEGSKADDVQQRGHCTSDHGACGHGHQHEHGHAVRWLSVLIGLGLHTLGDGVAMASGVLSEYGHAHGLLPGLGIFLVVLLHKPLDAISITSLMHSTTTSKTRLLVNLGFALLCPLGAFAFFSTAGLESSAGQTLICWGLAFSGGVFLCIALSDLLPEMEFHSHSRISLSVALLLGIFAAYAIGWFEGEHAHDHHPSDNAASAGANAHGHSHD